MCTIIADHENLLTDCGDLSIAVVYTHPQGVVWFRCGWCHSTGVNYCLQFARSSREVVGNIFWLPVMLAARRTLKCFLLLMLFTYLKQNRKNSPRLQPDVPVPAVVPSYGYDHLPRGTDYNAGRVAGCRDNS